VKFANCRRAGQMVALLTAVLIFLPALAAEQKPADKKIASVNGVAITQAELNREMDMQVDRLARQGRQLTDQQKAQLEKDMLESIIEREVLYQQSLKSGIQIKDQTVDDQLATIKKRFPSEQEFSNALKRMNLTEKEVKSQIKRGLAIRRLIDEQVARKIVISDADTRAYYDAHPQMFKQPEQVKASHILIKVTPDADDAQKATARKKIEEIQQKLKNGGDFAALAKEYSEGPSGARGGDLGFFRHGQMVKPFENAAFGLEPGQVSDVVTTRFGYHLIKVTEKKPAKTLAYSEVKDKIGERLKQQKIEKQAGEYIDGLKKDAKIEKTP